MFNLSLALSHIKAGLFLSAKFIWLMTEVLEVNPLLPGYVIHIIYLVKLDLFPLGNQH